MGRRFLRFAAVLLCPVLLAAPAMAGGQIPQAGTALDAINPAGVPGAVQLADGRWVLPARAARPDWMTPQLSASAKNAPTAAPAEAAGPDAPLSGYLGIRPGSEMVEPYGCTMNFVFQKSGVFAIGTAGHCVDKVGQDVTLLTIAPGDPPEPENLVLVNIGKVISRTEAGIGADFALVSIKPELQSWVFPTIAEVGGPCGIYTAAGAVSAGIPRVFRGQQSTLGLETVYHYGHGVGIGSGGTPRSGAALYWTKDAFYWDSPSIFGDSGSPVRVTALQAAGDLTHLVVDLKYPGAVVAGTRITKMLSLANGYSLVNSPYCPAI